MYNKFLKVLIVIGMCVVMTSGYVYAAVPSYLNYQAVLFDEAGNPIPDGEARIIIRILNSSMEMIYEEEQVVDVISGVVSVIVGEDVNLANDILLPNGPKYLEVQAEGYPPEDMVELVSVPYSIYADVALHVSENVVGSAEIKDGAIKIDDLSDEVFSGIEERIASGSGSALVVKEDFVSYVDSVSSNEGAKHVGIRPDFIYSAGNNVDAVLKDLDLAIKKRSEDVSKVKSVSDQLSGRVSGVEGRLSLHVADNSNPHNITPVQIGAANVSDLDNYVLESDLYDEGGKIKEEKMPGLNPSLAAVLVGRGRIAVSSGAQGNHWRMDDNYTTNECTYTSDDDADRLVACIIEKTAVPCFQFNTCSSGMTEIVPQFELYAHPAIAGGGAKVPTVFNSWVDLAYNAQSSECFCQRNIAFRVGSISHYQLGSSITWHIYSRSIGTE